MAPWDWRTEHLSQFQDQYDRLEKVINKRVFPVYINTLAASAGLAPITAFPKLIGTPLGFAINFRENFLFDLLKREGPIVLCDPDVQDKLSEWLSEKEIAQSKMTALRDALLTYACASPKYRKIAGLHIAKRGRPELECLRNLNKEAIKWVHQRITLILRDVKAMLRKYGVTKVIFNQILSSLQELSKSTWATTRKRMIKRFETSNDRTITVTAQMWEELSIAYHVDLVYSIFMNIGTDEILWKKFMSFKWMPFDFAKTILMRNLDISESKINKILYSRKS